MTPAHPTTLAMIDPSLMLTIGVGIIVFVAVTSLIRRNRQRQQPEHRTVERDTVSQLRQQSAMREDLQTLMVELEELSRRIGAQIDTRFNKLESVIADADERIAAMESLIRAARGQSTIDVTVGDEPAVGETPAPAPADAAPEPPPPKKNAKKKNASKQKNPPPQPVDADPKRARIFTLADMGKDPVEIAKATGSKPGEVELILALRDDAASNLNES